MTHPLTDRDLAEFVVKEIRIAYDKGSNDMLEQVIKWLKFDYLVDPSLSLEVKHRGDWWKIADALEKAMRPQQQEDN